MYSTVRRYSSEAGIGGSAGRLGALGYTPVNLWGGDAVGGRVPLGDTGGAGGVGTGGHWASTFGAEFGAEFGAFALGASVGVLAGVPEPGVFEAGAETVGRRRMGGVGNELLAGGLGGAAADDTGGRDASAVGAGRAGGTGGRGGMTGGFGTFPAGGEDRPATGGGLGGVGRAAG